MQAQISFAQRTKERWKFFRPEFPSFRILPLRRSADWRSIFFLASLGILFFVQWTGWLRHWSLFLTTCVLAFIACIIKHNHIHCRTFAGRRWNRALEYYLGFCTGQATAAIIPVHNERHHSQNHSDQDFVRSTLVGYRRNWLNLIVFPFVVVGLVHRNKSSDILRWREKKPKLYHRLQRERFVVLVFIVVLVLLDWRATLLYFGLPWLFAQWGIVTINLLQHQHCDHDSVYGHSRNVTGRFINWLFLNNGFHTAHHLRPAMHWSRLPKFHSKHVEPNMRAGLNHRSFLVCIWKQFFSVVEKHES
ncbi:MAG: fatty acid desaturase family protein [Limisphaerales bacterium]